MLQVSPGFERAGYDVPVLAACTECCSGLRSDGTTPGPSERRGKTGVSSFKEKIFQISTTADTDLAVFGGDGLCEALNGSFLTLGRLSERTQLTLHLVQLLLQLLGMGGKKKKRERKSDLQCD